MGRGSADALSHMHTGLLLPGIACFSCQSSLLDAATVGHRHCLKRAAHEIRCILQKHGGSFRFSGSWQETYLRQSGLAGGAAAVRHPLAVKGFYSDLLYQPWFCATTELQEEWLENDTIPRRAAACLSLAQFRAEYEVPNRPVIITGLVGARLTAVASVWHNPPPLSVPLKSGHHHGNKSGCRPAWVSGSWLPPRPPVTERF